VKLRNVMHTKTDRCARHYRYQNIHEILTVNIEMETAISNQMIRVDPLW
jgi:hypothetical protein